MPTAKRLPSGSWNCRVFSHYEPVYDEKGAPVFVNGKQKKKPIYESFTSEGTSMRSKAEVERVAAEFAANKKRIQSCDFTLREAINDYVNKKDALFSPRTVEEYRKLSKNAFPTIMDMRIRKITNEILEVAINEEAKRPVQRRKDKKPISQKTLKNEVGLVKTVLAKYNKNITYEADSPPPQLKIKELLPPEVIFQVVKDTQVELPALLAMWFSFSESEIRGIKLHEIKDGYLQINQTIVDVEGFPVEKDLAKVGTRLRRHKIPPYIQTLIDRVPKNQEYLVTLTGRQMYKRFTYLLKKNNLPHMTFHDLRHVNASVMAMLNIPEKYAMERGGWKTDATMKRVYTHTFSDRRLEVDAMIDDYFESQRMKRDMK